jgi:hypothetical protein
LGCLLQMSFCELASSLSCLHRPLFPPSSFMAFPSMD